jgi:hypothetical protein
MWKSPRLEMFEEGEADTARHLELDSAEEIWCNVLFHSVRYLQGVCRYHNRNIQWRTSNIRDMVLQWIQDDTGLQKLNSRWEGSFIVHKVTGPGSYCLQYHDGQEVPDSWNNEHLCHFHPWSIGDIFYWCLENDTSSTTPFYWFRTSITRKLAEGASLPYFQ